MSFLQLVFSLDKTFEEIILFWRICHLDTLTDTRLTDITTKAITEGGAWWRSPQMATAADSMHPTGTHSCLLFIHFSLLICYLFQN